MAVTARIADIAGHLPAQVLGNDALAALYPAWPADKILDKTGIRQRHIAAPHETAGDLACAAAQQLFAQGRVGAADVDFIILCTQTPDHLLPTTACLLQHRLGIGTHAGALDINLGCSGFVYGLSLAKGLVEGGAARCVLLLTSDTYSKLIHPLDKSVRTLFGDGAAATAVVASDDPKPAVGPFVFGTDGSGAGHLIVPAGGARQPCSAATAQTQRDASDNVRSAEQLCMDGAEVMAFTLREVPRAVDAVLAKAGLAHDAIDYFVMHQANHFMLTALRKKLRVPPERLPIVMAETGNTVSASIPLALLAMRAQGLLDAPRRLLLAGFGVGLSWAACVLNF